MALLAAAAGIMGVAEKIKEIEDEMARTQKNKATEYVVPWVRGAD